MKVELIQINGLDPSTDCGHRTLCASGLEQLRREMAEELYSN